MVHGIGIKIKHELNFFTNYEDNLNSGAVVKFDIIIPTEKVNFQGRNTI